MRFFRLLAAILLMNITTGLSAQRMLTASGSYTYYAPSNITLDQAKTIALERAKIQIIADNFGTVVGVHNYSRIENNSGDVSSSFLSLGESEVKGEWIETKGTPAFEVWYEDHLQVVRVSIRGVIREVIESKVQIEAKVLRNGISDKYESDVFKEGDKLFLSFKSPVDGYVAVFLYDKNGVSRLLPMKYDRIGSLQVSAGVRDVFFARMMYDYDALEDKVVESISSEYRLFCDSDNELNRLYIVFSVNEFFRPNDNVSANEKPAFLSFEQFQNWLSRSRRQDKAMTVAIKDILIRK